MDFVKMEGLGNDFVVIDGPADVSRHDVRTLCDRRRGVGADGVLVVTPLSTASVRMEYWNADGGAAEMCGNGLRCVARLAADRGWVDGPEFTVETPVGTRPVAILADGHVRVLLGRPTDGGVDRFESDGAEIHPVDMGNPHAVIFVDDPSAAPVTSLGPVIELDSHFEDGTNVEFATVRGADRIDLRVWERGVGETQACGTGAAATAYLANRLGHTGSRTTVALPGGDLIVDIDDDGAWIEGPANVVFSGVWSA